jgi:hypothetical protein
LNFHPHAVFDVISHFLSQFVICIEVVLYVDQNEFNITYLAEPTDSTQNLNEFALTELKCIKLVMKGDYKHYLLKPVNINTSSNILEIVKKDSRYFARWTSLISTFQLPRLQIPQQLLAKWGLEFQFVIVQILDARIHIN